MATSKYKAVKVDCEIDLRNGRTQKNEMWFAPGVGIVKSESRVDGRTFTHELKTFTPGKCVDRDGEMCWQSGY